MCSYSPNQIYRYEEEEDDEYRGYSNDIAGDIIYTKEIDTRSLPKSGSGRLLNISQFEDRLPDVKGIYHVMIRSTQNYWIRDSRFISFSDIGLIAKQGRDKMFVFANSLKTVNAMEGVTVNVYGSNNQLLGTGSTNADGVAEVPVAVKNYKGFKPAMIIAKTADDFTYLPFSKTRVNTSRFDVGGKRNNTTGLDAFIYAERDIYRPGERINYSLLLRDKNWKSPGEIPVKIKFLLPNGKELKSFRKSLNEQGAIDEVISHSGFDDKLVTNPVGQSWEPDQSALHNWAVLDALCKEVGAGVDMPTRLALLRGKIASAQGLYAKLKAAGVPFDPSTNGSHLRVWEEAIMLFEQSIS